MKIKDSRMCPENLGACVSYYPHLSQLCLFEAL